MKTSRVVTVARRARKIVIGMFVVTWIASSLAQNTTNPRQKASPPKIEPHIVLLAESVVQTQWADTLDLVNAPENVTLLNPGQCIRVGIYSTGDKRDDYLRNSKLSFSVRFASHSDVHPLKSLANFKKIKPEGGDFVVAVLSAAGVKPPEIARTTATLGASSDRWCAPTDAADGTATVEAEVESPSGHQALTASTVQIESFETGSKKPFKDAEELGAFSKTYYRQPNPARLLPAMHFMLADETQRPRPGQAEILASFLSAAFSSDPVAAQDFRTRVSVQPPMVRALGLLVLRSAGYDISDVLNAMSAKEQKKFLSLSPLQDPFDLTPTQALFQHLDMLWAVFEATGQFKPVQTIASALSWRTDYEDFDRLRKTPNHPSTLTPSIARGVVYSAAGRSLWSFQRNDPLVADYIDYMLASPGTSQSLKLELAGLSSNPAFKQTGGQ